MLVLTQLLALLGALLLLIAIVWLVVNEVRQGWSFSESGRACCPHGQSFGKRVANSLRDPLILPWWLYAFSFLPVAGAAIVDAVAEPEVKEHQLLALLCITASLSFFLGFLTDRRVWVLVARLAVTPLYFFVVQQVTGWSFMDRIAAWEFFVPSFYVETLVGTRGFEAGGLIATLWMYQELAAAGVAKRGYFVCSLGFFVSARFMMYCYDASGETLFLFFVFHCVILGIVMLLLGAFSTSRRLRKRPSPVPIMAPDTGQPSRSLGKTQ